MWLPSHLASHAVPGFDLPVHTAVSTASARAPPGSSRNTAAPAASSLVVRRHSSGTGILGSSAVVLDGDHLSRGNLGLHSRSSSAAALGGSGCGDVRGAHDGASEMVSTGDGGWSTRGAAEWLEVRRSLTASSAVAAATMHRRHSVPGAAFVSTASMGLHPPQSSRPWTSEASSVPSAAPMLPPPPTGSRGLPEQLSAHGPPPRTEGLEEDMEAPSLMSRSYRRPHILEVDLQDLRLSSGSSGEVPAAWYESVRYFVSLHPSSSRRSPAAQLPQDVPEYTQDGRHMVSSAQPCMPLPRPEDSLVGPLVLGADWQERLAMKTDRLDTHFVMYLWGRKASIFSKEDFLLGCRAVPLRDMSLHGRLAAWDISDIETGQEVAQVRMRCSVSTTPGPIQLPHLSDVGSNGLQLNWSPPLDDNGRPVTGYRVALLEPCTEEWSTVCECTKLTSCPIEDLAPSTVYMVDIRALNEIGAGDPCELEVATLDDGELDSPIGSGELDSPIGNDGAECRHLNSWLGNEHRTD